MGFFDDVASVGSDIVGGAQDLASDVGDALGGAAEDAGQAAEDAYNWASDQVESGAETAYDLFTSGVDTGSDIVDWSRNAFVNVVDWSGVVVSDAYDFGRGLVTDTVDLGIDFGSDAIDWTGTAVSDSYDFASGLVEDTVDFGVDFGSDAIDWTGQAAEDVGEYIWGRGGSALFGLADGAWQITEGAWLDLTEGVGRFTRGFKNGARGDWGQAFEDWGLGIVKTIVQTPADAILMASGRTAAAAQTIVGLEPEGRKLNDNEIATLKSVYGDAIDYDKIVIKKGDSFLKGLGGRPYTEGNVIYLPDDYSFANDPGTLIHEACHVWQHQNGGNDYMSESLWEQNFGEGYDWKQKFDAGIFAWEALNPEQQAQFIEDAFNRGYFTQPGGAAGLDRTTLPMTDARFKTSPFNASQHGTFLEQCLALLKMGQGAA